MPAYEFICQDCRKRSLLSFSYAEYNEAKKVCPHCQGDQLTRRISRIAVAKSEDARMDAMADDSMLAGLDEEDPRALGQFMRKMSSEMGEDLGEEFGEVVDRLEKGQSPDEIESAMPALTEADGGLGGSDPF